MAIKTCPRVRWTMLNVTLVFSIVLFSYSLSLFLFIFLCFRWVCVCVCVHNAAVYNETYRFFMLCPLSCELRSSRSCLVTYIHFRSGLTQCNGRCRINEVAATGYLSQIRRFFLILLLGGCESRSRAEEIVRRLILRFPFSPECDRWTERLSWSLYHFLLFSRSSINFLFFLIRDLASPKFSFAYKIFITQREIYRYIQGCFLSAVDFHVNSTSVSS